MSKKKKWIDFEITRVKLNPEQAVLSCCKEVGFIMDGWNFGCGDPGGMGGANPGLSS